MNFITADILEGRWRCVSAWWKIAEYTCDLS